jgi:sortase A
MSRSPAASSPSLARGVLLASSMGFVAAFLLAGCTTSRVTVTSLDDNPVFSVPSATVPPPASIPGTTEASSTTSSASTTTASAATTDNPTTSAASTTVATLPGVTTDPLPTPLPPPNPSAKEPYVEVGRISIPRLGLELPLLEGIALSTLDRGPGHWPGTAMPGQPGNVVVAGHRVSHSKPFRHIDLLQPGDTVTFTTPDGSFVYVVTGSEVVSPSALWVIDQTAAPTATLFACHPPGSTKQRYVVHLVLQSNA